MKLAIFFISLVFAVISTAYTIIWHTWIYPKDFEYALQLADDSSLPNVKADYLEQYLKDISTITGPPRYFFMRKDLELNTQREILQGLVTRFRDLSKISPNDMAYQQGMMQLTGQEMNNQLDRISGIFKDAKLRENPINYFIQTWVIFIFWAMVCVYVIWFMVDL